MKNDWKSRDSLGFPLLCIGNEHEDYNLHTSAKEDDDTATLHSHCFQLLFSLLGWYVIAWHTGRSAVSGVSSEVHRN